jgi:chemotaxis protein CheD
MSSLLAGQQAGKVVVGIADLKVSADPADTLVTYGLGSCLGIVIHDPAARVGGMLHAMLPTGANDPAKATANPARFIDTGLPILFKSAYALGAQKPRIQLSVVGGASMGAGGPEEDFFQIGRRNYVELKKMLWKNGVVIRDEDVGGNISRTVLLDVGTGDVTVKAGGTEFNLARQFPRRT